MHGSQLEASKIWINDNTKKKKDIKKLKLFRELNKVSPHPEISTFSQHKFSMNCWMAIKAEWPIKKNHNPFNYIENIPTPTTEKIQIKLQTFKSRWNKDVTSGTHFIDVFLTASIILEYGNDYRRTNGINRSEIHLKIYPREDVIDFRQSYDSDNHT